MVFLELLLLLVFEAKVGDCLVDQLVDSGTSFNFFSSALAQRLDWVCQLNGKVKVRLADGLTITVSSHIVG